MRPSPPDNWDTLFRSPDASFHANGKSFFFVGDRYYRWDDATGHVDPGYPRPHDPTAWGGLPRVSAALAGPLGETTLFD